MFFINIMVTMNFFIKLFCHTAITLSFSLAAEAQILTSIDYTPQEGTNWGNPTVRLNFGDGIGMGTISFQSINGGYYSPVSFNAPYNAAPYSSYSGSTLLSNGATYSPSSEVVFAIRQTVAGFGGFRMTVSLDSGDFPEHSVFGIRSLGQNASGNFQSLTLLSGLSPADSVRLPTDDVWGPPPDFADTVTPGVYVPTSVGSNALGRAFEINGNSFSVDLVGNYYGGGEAFTISVAPVPEGSSATLALAGIFGLCLRRRRPENID